LDLLAVGVIHGREIFSKNDSVFQAALLHDTIEDTETTLEELNEEFGPRVAGIYTFILSPRKFDHHMSIIRVESISKNRSLEIVADV
jgi:(p)ppGpp synthase/HD superfamily hydrolase